MLRRFVLSSSPARRTASCRSRRSSGDRVFGRAERSLRWGSVKTFCLSRGDPALSELVGVCRRCSAPCSSWGCCRRWRWLRSSVSSVVPAAGACCRACGGCCCTAAGLPARLRSSAVPERPCWRCSFVCCCCNSCCWRRAFLRDSSRSASCRLRFSSADVFSWRWARSAAGLLACLRGPVGVVRSFVAAAIPADAFFARFLPLSVLPLSSPRLLYSLGAGVLQQRAPGVGARSAAVRLYPHATCHFRHACRVLVPALGARGLIVPFAYLFLLSALASSRDFLTEAGCASTTSRSLSRTFWPRTLSGESSTMRCTVTGRLVTLSIFLHRYCDRQPDY